MPAPWKKQKGNKFSRIVADLQTPPKRGGSLVVETGFPTSIVDLFVKNRDRLRKPSKKKHNFKQPTVITDENVTDDQLVSDPCSCNSSLEEPTSLIDEKTQTNFAHDNINDSCGEDNVAHKESDVILSSDCSNNDDDEEEEEGENGGILNNKKRICLMGLEGSLIVVIALYTKRFILGITLGTFLLLLLEYVGISSIRDVKPCETVIKKFQGFFFACDQFVRRFVFHKAIEEDGCGVGVKREMLRENICSFIIKESSQIDDEMWDEMVSTIENLEPNVDDVSTKTSFVCPGGLVELQSLKRPIQGEVEDEGTKLICQNVKTKKGKKFWRKFIHKHGQKKKKFREEPREPKEECIEEFTPDLGEEEDDEEELDEPENFDSLYVEDISDCYLQSDNSSTNSSQQGAYHKFLAIIVVVLAGLIRDRIFALLLNMICCLMLKMIRS